MGGALRIRIDGTKSTLEIGIFGVGVLLGSGIVQLIEQKSTAMTSNLFEV